MTKHLLAFFFIAVITGCGFHSIQVTPLLESRSPLAESFYKQGKYAESLVQWQIILTANPDNQLVKSRINALTALISNKVEKLLSAADKSKASEDEKTRRKAYLRVLALDPNNTIAINALRSMEWEVAMEKANSKNEIIKEYFVETQVEAQRSILLAKVLEKGDQYIQGKKYTSLIKLADEFELTYPDAKEPQNWRFLAYSKLAERSLADSDIPEAITYYDMAISHGQKGSVSSLIKQNQKLRKQISDRHYTLAMSHFKSNLDKTIELLSKSLSFNANNVKAKLQLSKATKMRDNLLKIKNMQDQIKGN